MSRPKITHVYVESLRRLYDWRDDGTGQYHQSSYWSAKATATAEYEGQEAVVSADAEFCNTRRGAERRAIRRAKKEARDQLKNATSFRAREISP